MSQGRERATTEVQAVELHLRRTVRHRKRSHQGAHGHRLARLRRSHDGDIARGSGQIDDVRIASLLVGPVHDSDRDRQTADRVETGTAMTRNQITERGRIVQRRQPHLMRRITVPLNTIEDRVDNRATGGLGHCRRIVLHHFGGSHL
ncbi:Uncharacterised protein [Mycobacteroides abscessus subsp. abscessus]|nr:Uncharacterised protein [Mycobacteroides abscessus subsp. abscessus]